MADDLLELAFNAQREGLLRRTWDERAAVGDRRQLLAVEHVGLGLERCAADRAFVVARHAPPRVDLDQRNAEIPPGPEPAIATRAFVPDGERRLLAVAAGRQLDRVAEPRVATRIDL